MKQKYMSVVRGLEDKSYHKRKAEEERMALRHIQVMWYKGAVWFSVDGEPLLPAAVFGDKLEAVMEAARHNRVEYRMEDYAATNCKHITPLLDNDN